LTTPAVFKAFDAGIAQRDADGRTEQVEFLQGPRADLDDISLSGDIARIRVRFLAELRSRSKDIKGEAVDDRRTAELWTFERLITSRDPNWALARVEAAEA
jgi:predicted lipid-binding transport protein (Tim44 family)